MIPLPRSFETRGDDKEKRGQTPRSGSLADGEPRTGLPVVITKHGKPVAQSVPVPAEPKTLFGYMKNTVTIKGDIVAPTGGWSAVSGAEDEVGMKK